MTEYKTELKNTLLSNSTLLKMVRPELLRISQDEEFRKISDVDKLSYVDSYIKQTAVLIDSIDQNNTVIEELRKPFARAAEIEIYKKITSLLSNTKELNIYLNALRRKGITVTDDGVKFGEIDLNSNFRTYKASK